MSVQNMPQRQGYLAVSVSVPTVATRLATLIETLLGYPANSLAPDYREWTVQVDPEVSSTGSVRIGNGNLGTTVGGVVQKGATLVGASMTTRAQVANIPFGVVYAQAISSAQILNIQLWDY